MVRTSGAITLAALALLACDDGTGPEDSGQVVVRFEAAPAGGGGAAAAADASGTLSLEGSNGTLEIESVHLIVSELELEGDDDACPDDDGPGDDDGDDDCEEFEADPFLLDLPLDGQAVTVAAADVRPGVYVEFEFEVEDLDDDDGARLAAVLADARGLHPDWPDEGSMVVVGTFAPAGGAAVHPFRVFVEAEIEVESSLSPPLVVEADGNAALTVVLDAAVWFTRPDGTVLDLSLFDFEGSGDDLLELEVEFEDGVLEVEVDDG